MARFRRTVAVILLAFPGLSPAVEPGSEAPPRTLPPAAGDAAKAEAARREALALFGGGVWEASRERLFEAARLLEEAARLDPTARASRKAILPVYLALGKLDELEMAGEAVLKADPADAESRQLLAGHYADQGRPADAARVLADGLTPERQPAPPARLRMWRELARMRRLANDQAGAAEAWGGALAVLQSSRDALLDAGLSVETLARQAFEAAEERGEALLAVRQDRPALEAFTEAARLAAADPALRDTPAAGRIDWRLAELQFGQGKYPAALTALERYLRFRPQQVPAYELKVSLLNVLRRGRDVLPALREHVKADPHFVGLRLLLASKAAEAGEAREAEDLYRQVLAESPRPEAYRGLFKLLQNQRKPASVFEMLDEALAALEDKDRGEAERQAVAERSQAMLGVLRADADLLSEVLAVALERRPAPDDEKRTRETFKVLGTLAAKARQTRAAEDLLRTALRGRAGRRDPEFTVFTTLIGLLQEGRRHTEVAELCREALRERRFLSHAYFRFILGQTLVELDQDEEGLRELDKAVEQAVDDRAKTAFRAERAESLCKMGKADAALEDAKALFKDAKDAAETRTARLTLAQVELARQKFADSEAYLRAILADDPDDAMVLNALGYEMADQNRNLEEAERLIRRALELDRATRKETPADEPESAAYLDSLGWVVFRRGRFVEAREWLEKAYALPSGRRDPTVADHLGDVSFRLGDVPSARMYWREAAAGYAKDRAARRDGRPAEIVRKLKAADEK